MKKIFSKGEGKMKKSGFTFVEIIILLAVVMVLLAIAIPDFLQFGAKARCSEAKTNLASIATAEISYFAETNSWGLTFDEIGWSPQGISKYKYTLEKGGGKELGATGADPGTYPCNNSAKKCVGNCRAGFKEAPAAGAHRKLGFTAVAEGNLDADYNVNDCWWIDQRKIPNNSINDINLD